MSSMRVRIRLIDRLRSQRNNPQACLIATAAQRQWRGGWSVTHENVKRTADDGQQMTWRPSAAAHFVMSLYDAGLPVPIRSVKLVRGTGAPDQVVKPSGRKAGKKPAMPTGTVLHAGAPISRTGRARKVAIGVTAGGVLLLFVSGLAWVVFTIAGVIVAAAAAVVAARIRDRQRPAGAPQPHLHAPPPVRHVRQQTPAPALQGDEGHDAPAPAGTPDLPEVAPHLQQQPGIRALARRPRRAAAGVQFMPAGERDEDEPQTPSLALPERPAPDMEPVPAPVPKPGPVVRELPAETEPAEMRGSR